MTGGEERPRTLSEFIQPILKGDVSNIVPNGRYTADVGMQRQLFSFNSLPAVDEASLQVMSRLLRRPIPDDETICAMIEAL